MDPDDLSILIADDHPLFRSALQQVLGQLYPRAVLYQAANVAELQQQLDRHGQVKLLLLDLHMPGALGYSALSWATGQYPDTPVIMISANSHPDTVRRAIDHGADLNRTPIDDLMTPNCTLVSPGLLAAEALEIMEKGKFNALLVVDENKKLIGALNMHDLLRAGVV